MALERGRLPSNRLDRQERFDDGELALETLVFHHWAFEAMRNPKRLLEVGKRQGVPDADAQRFVGAVTFEALSGQAVGTSLWGEGGEEPLDHIQWAQGIDLVLVAPATLNFLGKMAHGLADDLPSTLITATDAPIMVAPAMNDRMWASAANRENLALLAGRGVEIVDPGSGYLACGTVAEGRLAETESIAERVLERAREAGATRAILKTRSPSCGCGELATRDGGRRPGNGVCAELLRRAGIEVGSSAASCTALKNAVSAGLRPASASASRLPRPADRPCSISSSR